MTKKVIFPFIEVLISDKSLSALLKSSQLKYLKVSSRRRRGSGEYSGCINRKPTISLMSKKMYKNRGCKVWVHDDRL